MKSAWTEKHIDTQITTSPKIRTWRKMYIEGGFVRTTMVDMSRRLT